MSEHSLFSVFEECLNVRPHLLMEVGYNRITDWMIHVYDATGVGIANAEKIIATQGDREVVMDKAAKLLAANFLS